MVKRQATNPQRREDDLNETHGDERVRIGDPESYESATAAVVAAVAKAKDVSPTELRPLFDRINTEALDSVVPSATVQFRYAECLVTASAEAVVVREPTD